MSKFNTNKPVSKKANSYEGGLSYQKTPTVEWLNMLFSCFMEDGFYEKAQDQIVRYEKLTEEMGTLYGWEFVAKAVSFSRKELGMRSISQYGAALLNSKQFENKRMFYKNFCTRPDDVSEMFAILNNKNEKFSHAFIRGCGDYLSGLSPYTLGKYKMKKKTYNMFDLINLTHATSPAINAYKGNYLPTPDTWETAISDKSKTEEERNQEWCRLLNEHKFGYLALLRNIRNLMNANCDSKELYRQLIDETAIKKSKVFPYQIYCAYKTLMSNFIMPGNLKRALSVAFMTSIGNVPEIHGDTVVILDVSGSMNSSISAHSDMSIKEVGAVYAATLFLRNPDTNIVKFASRAMVFHPFTGDTEKTDVFSLIESIARNDSLGSSTEIDKAFSLIRNHDCDYLFIISDMQIMNGYNYNWMMYGFGTSSKTAYNSYLETVSHEPICYSFDLGNYHSSVIPVGDWKHMHYLTVLNDKIFTLMEYLEKGEGSLVEYIKSLPL